MRSVLVTGGAGYIGSHAVLALLARGEKVVILDDLSESDESRVVPGAVFVKGSTSDAALVKSIVREHEVDSVIHFAGFIRVDESVREPEKYFRNNTENTRILVDAARDAGARYVIFSSSAAVYGNPSRIPIRENDPTIPINPYGESKLRAEEIVKDSDVHYVILRYFNVAGTDPEGRTGYRYEPHPTHMIRSCIRALLEHKPFTIYGGDFPTKDGTCVRDYIHVSDLAEAHISALEHLRSGGASRIYNCGDGHGYSNRKVVETVCKIAGKIDYTIGDPREGDPAELVADTTRIQQELEWKPKLKLEDMIRHELAWSKKLAEGR